MPEGDTVWRAAARLNAALAGRLLTRTDFRWPSVATVDLAGSTTREVVSRGKHLLQRVTGPLGEVTVHSHLRMEGCWRVAGQRGLATSGHDVRAVLETSDTIAVGRRLGMLDVVATPAEITLVGHLGPDLLGPDWDVERALENVRAAPATVVAALLDQRNLAGLGTMWAAETLFVQRLNPWTPAAELPETQWRALLDQAKKLLEAGKLHDVQSSTGSHVKGQNVYVHARSGLPCRRCGETVRVQLDGPPTQERTIFFCPRCQGPAPGDDGRPQAPLGSRPGRRRRYR